MNQSTARLEYVSAPLTEAVKHLTDLPGDKAFAVIQPAPQAASQRWAPPGEATEPPCAQRPRPAEEQGGNGGAGTCVQGEEQP